jgi:DNA-binding CsgD family transcriptional regulator
MEPPAGGALFERDSEIEEITAALAAAENGDGRVVVVLGEAGIGKTTLLEMGVAHATGGAFRVLSARGGALEQPLGFGIVRALFEGIVARASKPRRDRLLSGAAALAAPVIGFEPGMSERGSHGDTEFTADHGLYWLAANLAEEQPLLLVIDDAHWCDAASLRWLVYLARRSEELPIGILIAARPGEISEGADALELLAAEPVAHVLRPGGLSVGSSTRILERLCNRDVAADFARAAHAWTSGNPFLLTELAQALADADIEPAAAAAARMPALTPERVRRSALLRLAHLGAPCAAVARSLAILGQDGELHHAATLGRIPLPEASAAVVSLVAAGVLAPGSALRFAHPLIESVVYDDIAEAERESAHAAAARMLADQGASLQPVCAHLLRSRPAADSWVVETLRAGARQQRDRAAAGAAAALLRRALDEPPGPHRRAVLTELGMAEALAGLPGQAEEHLRAALESSDSATARVETAAVLCEALAQQGRAGDAYALARNELAHADGASPTAVVSLEVGMWLVGQFADANSWRGVHDQLEQRAARFTGTSAVERMALAALAVRRGLQAEPADGVISSALLALESGLIDDGPSEGAVGSAIGAMLHCDAVELAEPWIARLQTVARARGSVFGVSQAAYLQALAARCRGQLADVLASAELSIETVQQVGAIWGATLALALVVDASLDRGELDRAGAALARGGATGPLPDVAVVGVLLDARARWRRQSGDLDGALADLGEARARHETWGAISPGFTSWRSNSALIHCQRGDRDLASELVSDELALATRAEIPRAIGVALRADGLITGGASGLERLDESVRLLEDSPARLELARSLVELGSAQRRANQRSAARKTLERGWELARSCGAAPLLERASEELRSTGVRPRDVTRDGVESLSPAELRVCRMAAAGMANPEIAQALFVTRGTVESQLHTAYRKLDISSRKQLRGVLGG